MRRQVSNYGKPASRGRVAFMAQTLLMEKLLVLRSARPRLDRSMGIEASRYEFRRLPWNVHEEPIGMAEEQVSGQGGF